MKTTITLADYYKSELINRGKSEFYDKHLIVFKDDDFTFIKKMMKYDQDVESITNERIFFNERLENPEHDRTFKKTFVNRFLNKQIGRQTIEDFSSQVLYTFLSNYDYINSLYRDIDKLLANEGTQESDQSGTQKVDNRTLMSTLPQDMINLNVEDSELAYGDQNTLTRNKQESNNQGETTNKNYNLATLIQLKGLLELIFIDFEKNCFLQIF